jgi:hypothetical protein
MQGLAPDPNLAPTIVHALDPKLLATLREVLSFLNERLAIDILSPSPLIENLVLRLVGAQRVAHDYHDGILPDGRNVEVKSSSLSFRNKRKRNQASVFQFRSMRGLSNKQKTDLYLLVGNDGEGHTYLWIIPGTDVRAHLKVYPQMAFTLPSTKKKHSWSNDYLCQIT